MIPFYTAYQERKTEKLEHQRTIQKAEINLINEKTNALNENVKARDKALQTILKMSEPKMSLNKELYGPSNAPYSSSVWNESTVSARRKSRIAFFDSPEAQGMTGRFVDLVIGPMLSLQSMPVWDIISGSPVEKEKRQNLISLIETRWRLWTKSKKIDYDLDLNYYKLRRLNFEDLLIDGEYFNILRYSASRKRNPLTIQRISPENIQKIDSRVAQGNTEIDGIEYNAKGQAVAYHVVIDATKSKSIRISRFGPRSGRTFVIHNKIGKGRRGIGILVGIITQLTKISDLQALELQAMLINSLFAMAVETDIGGVEKPIIDKGSISNPVTTTIDGPERVTDVDFEARLNKTAINNGGIIVQNMGEGQKLKSIDTKRPSSNFDSFCKLVKRNLYAAKGIAESVVSFDLEASYSAIRGTLLIMWNKIMTLRFDEATDFDSVIYQMWLWGEIDRGKFDLAGWDDEETRDAWSNSKWIGPTRPDIDPLRSLNAHKGEVKEGFKSRQQQTAERGGGDYDDNVERLISENEKLVEANTGLTTLDKTTHSFSENKTESETKTIE